MTDRGKSHPDPDEFTRVVRHWALLLREELTEEEEGKIGEFLNEQQVAALFRETAEVLRREGWRIVRSDLLERGDLPAKAIEAVPIYERKGQAEHILGTKRLTVVLANLAGEEALAYLRKEGFDVARRHRWSRSAFALRIPRNEVDAFEYRKKVLVRKEEHDGRIVEAPRKEIECAFPELMLRVRGKATIGVPKKSFYYVTAQQWQWKTIHAIDAWQITRGDGTRIAVIDQSFSWDHPYLKDGVDQVASGFFPVVSDTSCPVEGDDLLDGAIFMQGVEWLTGTGDADHRRHGTAAAGMAAARPSVCQGLSGAAPAAQLVLIAVGGLSTIPILADAFCHAVEPWVLAPTVAEGDGADVISCSLYEDSTEYLTCGDPIGLALERVRSEGRDGLGTPFCWAASNSGSKHVDDDAVGSRAETIAVGATSWEDQATNASGVTLVAPGENVYTTVPLDLDPDGEDHEAGTSFAAPAVAGVASLVLAANPHLTAEEVEEILTTTCEKVRAGIDANYVDGIDVEYGHGRIDALAAVGMALEWLTPWRTWRHVTAIKMRRLLEFPL